MREFYQRNKWAIWVILASVLLVAGFVAYRNFISKPPVQPQVSVSIDAPQTASSGSEIIYKVTFSNRDTTSIRNVTLDMNYPSGFTFEDSSPKPARLSGNQFTLSGLDPSQEATIMIRGTITGNADETKAVSAVMHYSFSNFNSDFVAQAQAQTQIKNSDLMIQFEGPNKTTNSQAVDYDIIYNNTTSGDIANAKLKLTLPSTFKISKSDISADSTGTIPLGTVKANSNNKYNFSGQFIGADVGQQSFSASVTGRESADQNNLLLGTAEYAVQIDPVPLSADLSATDAGASADIVKPGDTITYKIAYKNNSATAATNVNIAVKLAGSAYDLSKIQAQNANISDNVITWDPSGVPAFATLGPGQSGQLNFTVQVKNPATSTSAKNLALQASTQITSAEYSAGFAGAPISSKIATVATVSGTSNYVVGANPPQAGQQTTYLVEVDLSNSSNDVDGATVTMSLPAALNFSKSSVAAPEGTNVVYDSGSRKLTWNVGKLAAHAGELVALRKLQFQVTVQPSASTIGQSIVLAKNITLQGTDNFTAQKINVSGRDIIANSY